MFRFEASGVQITPLQQNISLVPDKKKIIVFSLLLLTHGIILRKLTHIQVGSRIENALRHFFISLQCVIKGRFYDKEKIG